MAPCSKCRSSRTEVKIRSSWVSFPSIRFAIAKIRLCQSSRDLSARRRSSRAWIAVATTTQKSSTIVFSLSVKQRCAVISDDAAELAVSGNCRVTWSTAFTVFAPLMPNTGA
ncbi:hypothetical protein AB1Y20_009879 [Prymnesium parvum]|uniref:Uncharacterized protein n=1 Tax=Prymnesium parvum TaxID=97485 RepID=A0AB34K6B1_PRYPA